MTNLLVAVNDIRLHAKIQCHGDHLGKAKESAHRGIHTGGQVAGLRRLEEVHLLAGAAAAGAVPHRPPRLSPGEPAAVAGGE